MMSLFWAYSPISSQHGRFWCPFLPTSLAHIPLKQKYMYKASVWLSPITLDGSSSKFVQEVVESGDLVVYVWWQHFILALWFVRCNLDISTILSLIHISYSRWPLCTFPKWPQPQLQWFAIVHNGFIQLCYLRWTFNT